MLIDFLDRELSTPDIARADSYLEGPPGCSCIWS